MYMLVLSHFALLVRFSPVAPSPASLPSRFWDYLEESWTFMHQQSVSEWVSADRGLQSQQYVSISNLWLCSAPKALDPHLPAACSGSPAVNSWAVSCCVTPPLRAMDFFCRARGSAFWVGNSTLLFLPKKLISVRQDNTPFISGFQTGWVSSQWTDKHIYLVVLSVEAFSLKWS